MDLEEIICEKLKLAGNARAKRMFGSFNICLDNINLGLLCGDKWYLKKTGAGDDYFRKRGITPQLGVKGNNYIITDFNNDSELRDLACLTRDEIAARKKFERQQITERKRGLL